MGPFEYLVIGTLVVLTGVFLWHLLKPEFGALTWIWRILFSVCLLASMPVVFVLMAFSNLNHGFLYGVLYCIGATLWLIFFILKEGGRLRRGIYFLFVGLTAALLAAAVGVQEYQDFRFDAAPSVFSQIGVEAYLPYGENTQVAKLNNTASLQLKKDLPVLDGDSAFYPMYASFARAVYPNAAYDPQSSVVRASDTETAYQNLLAGKVNLIFVTEPSVQLTKALNSQKINLKMTPIAKEGLVFFTNAANPVNNLRAEDIKKIYAKEVTNWRDLGGKSQEILAFQHPKNSGAQTVMENFMNDIVMTKPLIQKDASDPKSYSGEVISYKNEKNAVGYGFRVQMADMLKNEQIKILSVNDVQASRENMQNKTYPVLFDVYAVTADNPDENTQKFVDWMLTEEGQKLVKDMGYVPVK